MNNPIVLILFYVVIIGGFWWLLMRPQKKEQKRVQLMLSELAVGDTVLTLSLIHICYDTFGPFKLVGGIAKGHPDEEDIKNTVEFVKGL